jgi:hypothetical protein
MTLRVENEWHRDSGFYFGKWDKSDIAYEFLGLDQEEKAIAAE